MNTGQTLLTIVAIMLLGSNVVSINRTFTQHGVVLQQTEIGVFGVSLAQSIVEEAQGRRYDANTTDSMAVSLNELSTTLGPEAGETTRMLFDDFDDYNGWKDSLYVQGVDRFRRWATVGYVNTLNLDDTSTVVAKTPSWHKKLTVFVKPDNSEDTIKISYIFSYWSFR
jgi:hypothetical protein